MAHQRAISGGFKFLGRQESVFEEFSKIEENSPEKNLTFAGEVVSY